MDRVRTRISTVHYGSKYPPKPVELLEKVTTLKRPEIKYVAPLYMHNNRWAFFKSEQRKKDLMLLKKIQVVNTASENKEQSLIPLVYGHAIEFIEQLID